MAETANGNGTAKNGKAKRPAGPIHRQAFAGRSLINYQPTYMVNYAFHPAQRDGWMSVFDIPAMLRCPSVRIGLDCLLGPLSSVQWQIKANNEQVHGFVDSTLKDFWKKDMERLARHNFAWGTTPGETLYTEEHTGLMRYHSIEEIYHIDTRVRHYGRQIISFSPNSVVAPQARNQEVWIEQPKMFWLSHQPPIGSPYGRPCLISAYGPWMERYGTKGATDIRRGWFFKNAYHSGRIFFPPGATFTDTNGNVKQNEDYARELIEKSETGNIMAFPMEYDEENRELWKFEDARTNGTAGDISQYPKDLDSEILWGMGVFPEIVRSMESGSGWSGRQVPLRVFLSRRDADVIELIMAFDRYVLRPLVLYNFGPTARYQIDPVSLLAEPAQGGPGMPPGQGAGMSPAAAGAPAGQAPQQPGGNEPMGGMLSPGGQQLQPPQGGPQPPMQMSGVTPAQAGMLPLLSVVTVEGDDGFVPVSDEFLDLLLGGVSLSGTSSSPAMAPSPPMAPSPAPPREPKPEEDHPHIHTPAFKNWFGDWSNPEHHKQGLVSRVVNALGKPRQVFSLAKEAVLGQFRKQPATANEPSKVVDEQGKPKQVYHGTQQEFDAFDPARANPNALYGPGAYFTENPAVAQQYAHGNAMSGRTSTGQQHRTITAHLNIKRPFDADWHASNLVKNPGLAKFSYEFLSDIKGGNQQATDHLKKLGYDGITLMQEDQRGPHRVWIAFHPHQVKHIGNKGSYDPKNPNMYLSHLAPQGGITLLGHHYGVGMVIPDEVYDEADEEQRCLIDCGMEDRERYAEDENSGDYYLSATAVRHAPKGGTDIGGDHFEGGEFLPSLEYEDEDTVENYQALSGRMNTHQRKEIWLRAGHSDPEAERRARMEPEFLPHEHKKEFVEEHGRGGPPERNLSRKTADKFVFLTGVTNDHVESRLGGRPDAGLLITPLMPRYLKRHGAYKHIAIDNGVFSRSKPFNPKKFRELIREVAADPEAKAKVRFVVAPDVLHKLPDGTVVGDAEKTLEQFPHWGREIRQLGLPVALVAQDGLEDMQDKIPWGDFDVLFIGGSTAWKLGMFTKPGEWPTEGESSRSRRWMQIFKEADRRGVPVHVGRVNSWKRIEIAVYGLGAASVDGTYLGYGPRTNLPHLEGWLDQYNGKPSGQPDSRVPANDEEEKYHDRYDLSGVHHAPHGGVTIAGKHFEAGQFIPAEYVAEATDEQMHKIKHHGQKPAQVEPDYDPTPEERAWVDAIVGATQSAMNGQPIQPERFGAKVAAGMQRARSLVNRVLSSMKLSTATWDESKVNREKTAHEDKRPGEFAPRSDSSEEEEAEEPWDGQINDADVEPSSYRSGLTDFTTYDDDRNEWVTEVFLRSGNYDNDHPDAPGEVWRWEAREGATGELVQKGPWVADSEIAERDGIRYAESNHQEASLFPSDEVETEEDGTAEAPPRTRAPLGKSKARVVIDDDRRLVAARELFPNASSDDDVRQSIASCVGAPDDAKVIVSHVGLSHDAHGKLLKGIGIRVEHPAIGSCQRFMGVTGDGKRVIENTLFRLKQKETGLGTAIFAKQVDNAAEEGFDYIITQAAGDYGTRSNFNGYYTWPRLGYNESLKSIRRNNRRLADSIEEMFPNAKSVRDVMATKAGRDWWLFNGSDLEDAVFDLREGSWSRYILDAYLDSKEKKNAG